MGDGNEDDLELALPVGHVDAPPEAEYMSIGEFARYIGLAGVVVAVCMVMAVVEIVAEVKRLWRGEGTLWR